MNAMEENGLQNETQNETQRRSKPVFCNDHKLNDNLILMIKTNKIKS
jgi:hypothetical protein